MSNHAVPTFYAPGERDPQERIEQQAKIIANLQGVQAFFDALPHIVIIVNEYLQTVFCNQALYVLLNIPENTPLAGLRPGELLCCVHPKTMPGGCGTTEHCRTCGLINTVLRSRSGQTVKGECSITVEENHQGNTLEFGITASPLTVDGYHFTIISLNDISDVKRRRVLERVFFHDIINAASGLNGFTELLREYNSSAEAQSILDALQTVAKQLVQDIQEQRDLLQAETNEFQPVLTWMSSSDILREAVTQMSAHPVAAGQKIIISPDSVDVLFISDISLVRRVLVNMLKNALEASKIGDIVQIGCRHSESIVEFWVNNPAVMPRNVQLQIFKRSFSTKGTNRGIGTYSMKLLTERYLRGTIAFSVSESEGTTFFARFPLEKDTVLP
ncbi:sensor histidine kinase [Heliophilum fasciatum]|uniref:histidine kinase n=1 Tax=Heliophilum fasciatum TaxID=35700 RepID=A0A4R2RY86_9FIRM|nr:HAMP domain-containing sensor histidine kinase [Heliophilum fasciatum]MCW2276986.1 hypothetical protein [Heliophilum fasciatum]TCP68488.1 histidine kinase/DNA gyrase B/HSP90-like ATPase [Heliophilum fasciatum]